jgi:PAS domain S-box-containing protein
MAKRNWLTIKKPKALETRYTNSPGYRARLHAARLILWGNAALLTLVLALQMDGVIPWLRDPSSSNFVWVYAFLIFVLLITALAALSLSKRSLSLAMHVYAWMGMLCIGGMILYDALVAPQGLPWIAFSFHMGIFTLGLILGLRAALTYATATSLLLIVTSVTYYPNPLDVVPVVITAYGLTLPAVLIDYLIKDLQQSEEKFSIVVRETLDVILVLDTQTNAVLCANQAARRILGYAERDLIGQPFARLLPPPPENGQGAARDQTGHLALQNLSAMLTAQETVFESLAFQRADGTLCPMDLTATTVPWENGQAILVTLRDITLRKQTEEELRKYRDHLEDLVQARTAELEERNEELDAFAHTVAHDLTNSVQLNLGYAEVLSEDYTELPKTVVQKSLRTILETSHKMHNIIEELMLLYGVRKQDVERVPLDMTTIIQEAQKRLVHMIQKSDAEIIAPDVWPVAIGHGPWVEEVWVNYISNALKYGGDPPKVELGAREQSNGHIHFWVRDNGHGLTLEQQTRLFTPFTRLDQVRATGNGLGLSIVRSIVEKLDGQVDVQSEVGKGSVFIFTLPGAKQVLDNLDSDISK